MARPTRGTRDRDQSLQLMGAYGQTVSTVIGAFALLVTVGAALVGLYAFVAAADPSGTDVFDFAREFSLLLQGEAWTKVDGEVVYWRDVLLMQVAVAGLSLLALVSSVLATLLHAQGGRVEATRRAHSAVFGTAYVLLAALISIPCIALASGYPSGRLGAFWLAFGVLWLVVVACGLPFGHALWTGARAHVHTGLRAVVGFSTGLAWLSGAIDTNTLLGVVLVGALLEVLVIRSEHSMDSLIKRYPLLTFFVLAYGITWLAVIPFALGAFPVPMFPFGPLVAAIIVAAVCGGWQGTKSLLLRMVQWRAAPRWYAFALLLPAAVTVGAAYVNVVAFGASDPTMSILAALPSLIPAFAIMMLNPLQGSMGEELGWRGFALPRLLSKHSPLVVSLVLGVLVAIWHAPLFVTGIYANAWLHILFIVTTTVLYTLLHNGTGGSVLLAMVFHTGWNLMPEVVLFSSFQGAQLQQSFTLYTVGGIAVSIVVTILAWRQLTRTHSSATMTPVPAPVPPEHRGSPEVVALAMASLHSASATPRTRISARARARRADDARAPRT